MHTNVMMKLLLGGCPEMCTHLRAAPLDGCGDSDLESQAEWFEECEDALADGMTNEVGLACGISANTCEEYQL